jgi:hypothetical protein
MAKTSEMRKVVDACKKQGLTYHGIQASGHHLISDWDKIVAIHGVDEKGKPPKGSVTYVSIACSPRRDNGVNNAVGRLRRELDFKWKGH